MKSNKGFTLIELLAVIVVLAIIALIAVPMVLNTINEARKGAAQSSAYAYISKTEEAVAMKMINGATNVTFDQVKSDVETNLKGTKPTSVSVELSNGTVTSAEFVIDGKTVTYTNGKALAS